MHDSSKQARSSLAVGQQELKHLWNSFKFSVMKAQSKKNYKLINQIEASSAAHQIQAFSPF